MNNKIEKCRACEGTDLWSRVNLGNMAFTGIFKPGKTAIPTGDLCLIECQKCGLVQLDSEYDPEILYGENYGYRSGLNSSMVKHLHEKAEYLMQLVDMNVGDAIYDIGSNDGTLLNAYPAKYLCVGFDPLAEKYKEFYAPEIEILSKFFNTNGYISGRPKAKIITTIAMFYDLNDPISFAKDVKSCLHEDGIWNIEMQYLPKMEFDAICHEHAVYYNYTSLYYVIEQAGLKIVSVDFNNINGGSISVIVRHENHKESAYITQLFDFIDWQEFNKKIDKCRENLIGYLHKMKEDDKKVYGLGASTKGNVLLQYCNITTDLLPVIIDINPDKKGCVTPGTNIPIVMEGDSDKPDAYVVLPWHFKDNIIQRHKNQGVDLVFPLPEFEIVTV